MFEALHNMTAAWREVARISEWTGVSVTALVLLALGFLYLPGWRRPAIAAAVGVCIAYGALLHGAAIGRADVEAQWDDARKAAIEADADRDSMTDLNLRAEYGSQIAALSQRAQDNQKRAQDDARRMLGLAEKAKPSKAGGPVNRCELGSVAGRLRRAEGKAR